MKFFLDTANLDEIRQAASLGILDGITTNPSLAAKEKKPFRELILEICEIVKDGIVNAEVVSIDYEGMLREAHEVVSWHPNVVAKIPMVPEGVRALSKLSREGVRVNVTLVFSPSQALIAAKAGAVGKRVVAWPQIPATTPDDDGEFSFVINMLGNGRQDNGFPGRDD